MKIKNLVLQKLNIPFKAAFQHASAIRLKTDAVIAIAESESGHTGYGEGCPRPYVTGETTESCFQFFEKYRSEWQAFTGLDCLKHWIFKNQTAIDANPSAFCSIELALLDLFAQEENCTVEALLSLPEINGSFEYTAVMGLNNISAFNKQLKQYQDIGFCDYKIKICGKLEEDQERIASVASILPTDSKIRLDANNAWSRPDSAIQFLEQLDLPIFAVEDPIGKNDFAGHREIFKALGLPVILDESFCNLSQFRELASAPEGFIINLRVSKMGGLLRSLDIISQAKRLKIPVITGAQVGETSLLTRAALTVCNAYRETVVGQEGAFGTYLLEHDIIHKPLMFGSKGILTAVDALRKPGLGIEVDPKLLGPVNSS